MQVSNEGLKTIAAQIGRNINRFRKSLGWTQAQLESQTEIGDVGNLERGEMNPTLLTLLRVATALNVEIKELFDFSEEDSEEGKIKIEIWELLSRQDLKMQKKALEVVRVLLSD